MRKLPARKLLGAVIAGALLLPNTVFSLGLGEIEVNSALNQTLNADIELLSATIEDTENLIIKLASRKEFSRAGLDRPYLLNDLRFKSQEINGVPYINVSSGSPIREPFLNFLVEIDWPNGHLLREYTVLLDPPVFMTQSASTASAPANQSATAAENSGFRPATGGSANVVPVAVPGASAFSRPSATFVPAQQVQPTVAAPAPVSQTETRATWVPAPATPAVKQQAIISQPANNYRIQAGDTAWSLADAMRPDQSVSVVQMMIALLRENPESFINGNINGLKRGYILRVPDYDQIMAIDLADAREMVRKQAALWRQYQQSQRGGQPVSAMEADASADAGDGSAVVNGEENDAYLEIVSAGSGSSTASGKDPTEMNSKELRAELALARERVETELVEKEALQQRVGTLEQHIDKMKGMLSIEDEELAVVQSLNTQTEAELVEDETVAELAQDAAESIEQTETEADVTEELDAEAEVDAEAMDEVATETDSAEQAMDDAAEESTEAGEEEILFADEAAVDGSEESLMDENIAADMPVDEELAIDDADVAPPQIVQAPEVDLLTRFLSNPVMLAAVAGGLLLIAGIIGFFVKRRKDAASKIPESVMDDFDDLGAISDDVTNIKVEPELPVEDQALDVAESVEEDFDSDATMVLNSAEDTIVTEEVLSDSTEEETPTDDVIAEADVYLAYGIYQQAEELLVQAIADNPERDDYRLKLAETHYASKNAEAFAEVANEIKKRTDDIDSPLWKKMMSMGQDLCADNPMFQGSMVGGLDADAMAPDAPSMDFDLGDDEADAPDLDLSLDDTALELPDVDADATVVNVDETATAEPADELEFDISETDAVEASDTADEFSLDIEASELDIESPEAASDDADESIDMGDLGLELDDESAAEETLDVGGIDLDFGLEDDSAADTAEAEEDISLDLSDEVAAMDDESLDIELVEEVDVETAEVETAEVETAEVSSDATDDDDFDLSSLGDVDEVSTKLDLARAYHDMGDNEGTRGILEEVLADGNDEQKKEANDLMAKLT